MTETNIIVTQDTLDHWGKPLEGMLGRQVFSGSLEELAATYPFRGNPSADLLERYFDNGRYLFLSHFLAEQPDGTYESIDDPRESDLDDTKRVFAQGTGGIFEISFVDRFVYFDETIATEY